MTTATYRLAGYSPIPVKNSPRLNPKGTDDPLGRIDGDDPLSPLDSSHGSTVDLTIVGKILLRPVGLPSKTPDFRAYLHRQF